MKLIVKFFGFVLILISLYILGYALYHLIFVALSRYADFKYGFILFGGIGIAYISLGLIFYKGE